MTLTKDDLQAIGTVVEGGANRLRQEMQTGFHQLRGEMREEIQNSENRVIAETSKKFGEQREMLGRHFDDLKAVLEDTYVKRGEFEELQSEVSDLQEQVKKLSSGFAGA